MIGKRLIAMDICHPVELDKGPFGRKDPWKYNEQMHRAPLAFICAPFTGDVDRYAEIVRERCKFAYDQGYIPVAPYMMYPRIYTEKDEDTNEFVAMLSINLLFSCDEFWLFVEDSPRRVHMTIEENCAFTRNKPIRYIPEDWRKYK